MDNMKNGVHADTAEAENTETMDLLADAATHCGDNDEDDKRTAPTAGTAAVQDGKEQK